jgi:hypothetical protein
MVIASKFSQKYRNFVAIVSQNQPEAGAKPPGASAICCWRRILRGSGRKTERFHNSFKNQ